MKSFQRTMDQQQQVIIGLLDGSAWKIKTETKEVLVTLWSDHEEADSRMFVYAAYLCNSLDLHRVTILSPDTDVAVIACYQICHSLRNCQEVWFLTGFAKNRRFIPLHTAYITLGASICKVLPVFHCLTVVIPLEVSVALEKGRPPKHSKQWEISCLGWLFSGKVPYWI